ncbi:hypothetical protein M1L60_39295 [Actinoplanes sp. TRM 88003]|uniref:Uncharacterized protein n=1 Tax=Paractinoplanes aksuensis TaxID=2939490 RepID=A0ABT1E0L6_9ACTN|nr:hypothetical protein [Actinoplanes aksuensis]MCO8276642.1 hypothetical protein [Actinoplanes aksuensis]
MRKIIATALSAVLILALGPAPARADASTEIQLFWTTLAARGAAVDVNFGITCPVDVDGTATVAITQTRDDGLTASGTGFDEFSCRNGSILNITRVTASVLGAPFERGSARLTMVVTGAAPINRNVRLTS